jgi:orotidine-5'-phosphate decarboxylase
MAAAQIANPIIIALDVDSVEDAQTLVRRVGNGTSFYKVGLELYSVAGVDFVRELLSDGKQVFLDLKLYDIGETVKRATARISELGVTFLTVHAVNQVMKAAAEGRGDRALELLAVTVLTSFDQQDVDGMGYEMPLSELVLFRAKQALEAGMDGVICSPVDVAAVRRVTGQRMRLVTPGVRSAGAATGDQKRVATPRQAIQDGADYLVIGRQVTRAADPRRACEEILAEIAAVVSA